MKGLTLEFLSEVEKWKYFELYSFTAHIVCLANLPKENVVGNLCGMILRYHLDLGWTELTLTIARLYFTLKSSTVAHKCSFCVYIDICIMKERILTCNKN